MPSRLNRRALLAIVATLTMLVACQSNAVTASQPDPTAANKVLVTDLFNKLLYDADTSVIDKYVSPTYRQHNPRLADGPAGLRALLESRRAQNPQPRQIANRVVAQGDLVVVWSDYQRTPGVSFWNIADTFRVANDKLVEHWDVIEPVPATTASGNDLYSTLSVARDGPSDPRPSTAGSQEVVQGLLEGLRQRHDPSTVDRYIAADLYQHDPVLPNGAAAVRRAYETDRAVNPNSMVSSVQVVAQDDYVTIRYHYQPTPTALGKAVAEAFRVRDGRIVEHWITSQDVPAASANTNTMF